MAAPVADARAGARSRPALFRRRPSSSCASLRSPRWPPASAAVYCALLFTDRRFAPTAFYQAALNVCTIAGALSLWKLLGVYGFAIGYTAGACAQLAIVYFAARRDLVPRDAAAASSVRWREILAKPALFRGVCRRPGLEHHLHARLGHPCRAGMAAALDYCMRGVGVPLALLVNPISNSLLPEIARLRSLSRCGKPSV